MLAVKATQFTLSLPTEYLTFSYLRTKLNA